MHPPCEFSRCCDSPCPPEPPRTPAPRQQQLEAHSSLSLLPSGCPCIDFVEKKKVPLACIRKVLQTD